MRGYQTINTSIFAFCFAFFAKPSCVSAQTVRRSWIQYQEQPKELSTLLRHSSASQLETSINSQKLVTGTDLNFFDFNFLYHTNHTYGLNLKHFGSPDYQTFQGSLGYLWHNPKFDVSISSQWQKSTANAWEFSPAISLVFCNTRNSKLSAFYQVNESMGLGYHCFLSKGGIFNVNYSIPTNSMSDKVHQLSCSIFYPASQKIWLGVESHPQQRFNRFTLLYRASNHFNTALQSGYYSSFQTFHLSFYAGLTLP